ncbi:MULTISPECIES: uroporphyrinogen-III synthase [Brucella]|uniref:Uroporphyrinogen-III synthase n=1 Tax=Ochrobactrum soli TaxID=2448455 RepID=A0A2P9HR09_9HYPH|nr:MULTISPECIES: uroporphyrinogen-III synthase [Brucella]MDX4073596.1 uroporphyrinogen-III synthase [Brucella sp. NBRC 113783]WHS31891.1 uroporphyrinogen-III synthase [Brucella sp. NM4]WHT41630.1 uroporphyrinogen-III synthase [Ochrobactrum sp. SSR]SPL66541.1 Uroporphyrinogen-III synthase [[Ochrobactrum] soli]
MNGPGEAKAGRRVLVTRPEPAASQTASRLLQAGFEPVLLPLSRTVSLAFSIPGIPFAALTVTSANAFRHVERAVLPLHLPLFAVGEGTAQAAREAGFGQVIEGGGDAVRLAETMRQALPAGARVLYLAGRVRQPVFEERIAAAGIEMAVCDVYDIEPVDYTPDAFRRILGQVPVAAVMLYSGVAAGQFVDAMRRIEPPFNENTRFLCISARVADRLPAEWQQRALTADHPDEKGLFRLFPKL